MTDDEYKAGRAEWMELLLKKIASEKYDSERLIELDRKLAEEDMRRWKRISLLDHFQW